MPIYDVVLLTEARYDQPAPADIDWYVQQVLTEDQLVQQALTARGLRVARLDWATPHFNWADTRLALFRTTWDYFLRFAEFSAWLTHAAAHTQLLNPAELVRWNLDKSYLLDLQARGVHIPPTRLIRRGQSTSLAELHQQTGWTETILKPTVSGAARHTYRLTPHNLAAHEAIFAQLLEHEDLLLQPFQHDVPRRGEVSLMVLGGRYSHAVLKVAKPGDFRVQDDHGGTVHAYTPTAAEVAFAEQAVAACQPAPLYARVDVIQDNDGQLAVMELELVEPEMWFRLHPPAADQLAAAIVAYLAD